MERAIAHACSMGIRQRPFPMARRAEHLVGPAPRLDPVTVALVILSVRDQLQISSRQLQIPA
jgi:hypothetical protein